MARFSCGFVPSGAGSTTLPMASLISAATVTPRLVEAHVFNTTSTAVTVALRRFSTAGTAGTAQTIANEDDTAQSALSAVHDVYTSTAPTAGAVLRVAALGAAIGSGVIWTFGGGKTQGAKIPNTTTDFIGVITLTGTAQVCAVTFVWDE